MAASFLWHDYETFGADPFNDRPAEFGAWRTDEDFQPIEEPVRLRCRPTLDYLPDPQACAITGIGPCEAFDSGLDEPQFASRVHAEMAEPGTCTLGYNSIRFDDEFTRQLLWRNFHDPYEREWRNGNSRFDLIDTVRAWYALRPQGLKWPEHEPGRPSFRLEDLARANALPHHHAHSALSDVEATLELARRLRQAQPRLLAHALELRRKQKVLDLLDWRSRKPLVHVSQRFAADRGCLAMVLPVAPHPTQAGKIVVVDCAQDPRPVLEWSAEDLTAMLLRPGTDPERVALGIKLVHANRAPFLAPLSVLAGVDLARIKLDRERNLEHARLLAESPGLDLKLQAVQALLDAGRPVRAASEAGLYDGFLGDADRTLCRRLREAQPTQLASIGRSLQDPRLHELLRRYRARHHPMTLDAAERSWWLRHCRSEIARPERSIDMVETAGRAMLAERPELAADLLDWCARLRQHAMQD